MRLFHWHRWRYDEVVVEHDLSRDSRAMRCDAHRNGPHLQGTPVRLCVKCQRLEGGDLPGGASWNWDSWERITTQQGLDGYINSWKWPFEEDVRALPFDLPKPRNIYRYSYQSVRV